MKTLEKNWSIITLSLLANLCLLFALNYSTGQRIYEEVIPYNLSQNYIELKRSEQSVKQPKELIDFTKYGHLIVIAELVDSRSVGLLDLQMKYYSEASKVTAPSVYRYFSEDDYRNHSKVGILINDCDFFDIDSVKSSKNTYRLDEVINCFQTDVWDYGKITMIQNIYSVDSNEIARVFIDSSDIEEIRMIKKELLNDGFTSVGRNDNIPILGTVIDSIFGDKHERFMMIASVSVFLIYIFMSFLFSGKYMKFIRISKVVGGDFKMMLGLIIKITVVISLVISCLATLMILYFDFLSTNYLSIMVFLKIQLFMFLCNLIVVVVSFYMNHKRIKNLTGRLHHG